MSQTYMLLIHLYMYNTSPKIQDIGSSFQVYDRHVHPDLVINCYRVPVPQMTTDISGVASNEATASLDFFAEKKLM